MTPDHARPSDEPEPDHEPQRRLPSCERCVWCGLRRLTWACPVCVLHLCDAHRQCPECGRERDD